MPVGGLRGGGGAGLRRTSRTNDEEALVPQGSSIADRIAAFNTLKGKEKKEPDRTFLNFRASKFALADQRISRLQNC